MNKSVYHISQMDCPSEENLIKMKLGGLPEVVSLEFNLSDRILDVFHEKGNENIGKALESLNLGTEFRGMDEGVAVNEKEDTTLQRKMLWIVLLINLAFFFIEMTTGLISKSMGLVADSLDMLADTFIYAMSLIAVGASVVRKKRVAMLSGASQIILASLGLIEVVRRFIGMEEMPEYGTMIVVSVFALVANVASLWLLQRTRSKDAHIQASVICSSNDVIVNFGVILAGLFVWWLNSNIPDLIIGLIVFSIVIRGAVRILQLAK